MTVFHRSFDRPRGVTFIEVLISVGIVSFVMIFLVYITVLQGRKSNYIARLSVAEARARNTAEFIRYRVMMGRFGSVSLSNNGRTLTFNDPNIGTVNSSFTFSNGELLYDDDVSAGPNYRRRLRGLSDVQFAALNNGAMVEATVKALATPYSTQSPPPSITVEQKVKIYLRN
ncbi:MAG: hypothetical protein Kow0059_08660 [Candidatus Sumerlaeia bacterium]